MSSLRIDIWSDVACPWCYIGKRRLEAALHASPRGAETHVVWRSFELDPSAPRESDGRPFTERLARKYGTSLAQASAMIERVRSVAHAEDLNFDFERLRAGNTLDAHRLLHWGATEGVQDALKEQLFRAYFVEGASIVDPDTLVELATRVGLDANRAQSVLQSDAYLSEVRADEFEAKELGISGVPFFVFDERIAVSGAQPVAVLTGALEQAFASQSDKGRAEDVREGAFCGPDGC
jgi:predicted DsbA family dithiol-disulfide isomerase